MRLMYTCFLILFLSIFWGTSNYAVAGAFQVNSGFSHIDLGPLNAVAKTTVASNFLEITEVNPGPLLNAGFQVGDKITAANDVNFLDESEQPTGEQPREAFGTAFYNSALTTDKILKLKVERGTATITLNVTVPAYASDAELFDKICADIARQANSNGSLGTVTISATMGMVLMLSDNPRHAENVRNLRDYYLATIEHYKGELSEGNYPSNWILSYMGMFLGEYYLATGDELSKAGLLWVSHQLAIHTNGTGCLSHNGLNYEGDQITNNPYDIRGMSIITTHALMVWGLVSQAGLLTDALEIAARDKTLESLEGTIHSSGNVDYIIGRRTAITDSQGRSANYSLALALTNHHPTSMNNATAWLVEQKNRLLFGHAASHCSFWASVSSLYTLKPTGWEDALAKLNWYYALSQCPEGSESLLFNIPARQNSGGDYYLNGHSTTRYNVMKAHMGMLLALRLNKKKLHIHGGRQKNWYLVNEVNAHLVEVDTGKNGTASPNYILKRSGETQSVTITPNAGYRVDSVRSKEGYHSITGDRSSAVNVSFSNLSEAKKLYVTFVKDDVALSAEISGLALHLDANVIDNSDTVSKWQDYSGLDRSAFKTRVAQEPNLQADQLNDYPLLDFSGDKHFNMTGLKWSDLMTRATGGVDSTWYVVTRVNNLADNEPYQNRDDHTIQIIGDSDGHNFVLGVDQYGFRAGRTNDAGIDQGPQAKLFDNQPVLLEVVFDGADMTLNTYYAAGQYSSQTKTMGNFTDETILDKQPNIANEGRWDWNNFYDGKIGEIMIYNRTLPEGDRQSVRNYLISKWIPESGNPKLTGLTASSGHSLLETAENFRRNFTLLLPTGTTTLDLTNMSTLYGAKIHPADQRIVPLDLTKESQVIPIRVVSANGDVTNTYYVTVYFRANLEWNFDEASGSLTSTSSTPSLEADVTGPVWTAGISGTALQFDDNNHIVDLALNDMLPPWSLTFRINRQDSASDTAYLLNSPTGSVRLEQSGNRRIGFTNPGAYDFSFNYTIPKDRWTTLALVCDGTGTKLYANGEFVEETDKFINLPLQELGSFKGTLDDLMIHRKALSANQVKGTTNIASIGQGALTEEIWSNIDGSNTTSLTTDPRYPDSPDVTQKMTNGFEAPTNVGSSFGRRIRGYIKPDQTGEYTFWISSDDYSDFYLSDGTQAASATRIAYVDSWSGDKDFDKSDTQKSAPIMLQAGRKYYVEVLHKEGGGGDHCAVAWQPPGSQRSVIPADNLFEYTPVTGDGNGLITEQLWEGVAGNTVADLTPHATYPLYPDKVSQLTRFEAISDSGSTYGRRISGYIHPPTSGKYTFWIASDDDSELWLSTDDESNNKLKIANLSGYSSVREWDKNVSQQSVEIDLVAGQRYYIEALHKEGGGGDHVSVAWLIPGELREVIDGCYLSAAPYNQPEVTLTLEPGWNAISLPFEIAKADALNAYGSLWIWKGEQYQQVTTPAAMQGFWVYNSGSGTETVTYQASAMRSSTQYQLKSGWNLAGPTESCPVPQQILSIWEWQSGVYVAVNSSATLLEGSAYWFFNPDGDDRLISLPE